MEKVTFTPAEFAACFGKERTWGYRQLYAGKVQAITELGRTLIPKSEVDRLLNEAGRYLGAGARVKKADAAVLNGKQKPASPKPSSWVGVIKRRRERGLETQSNSGPSKSTPTATKSSRQSPASKQRQAAFDRLARNGQRVKKGTDQG